MLWEQLLEYIECGNVIPVVGQDLAIVELNGRRQKLYSHLAESLAGQLGVATTMPDDSLNAVACRYKEQGKTFNWIYTQMNSVLRKAGELPIPDSLRKLAEITHFKLFVTTTFDDLLKRALDRVRFGGQARTRVLAYSPKRPDDVTSEQLRSQVPLVYHLFGQVSPTPEDYALTDEDVLEFVHALQTDNRRPERLFDELNGQSLLLIGNSFSDWLARFFIRMAGRERLRTREKIDFVADLRVHDDPGLVQFLGHFSSSTCLFSSSATDFVDELHKQWMARNPRTENSAAAASTRTTPDERGCVFLSYAREDKEAVGVLCQALKAAGLPVWMDEVGLRAGDDWEERLKDVIDVAALFIPVISRDWVNLPEGYFRYELQHAVRRAPRLRKDIRFLLPIVIDGTLESDSLVPAEIRRPDWGRAPGGRPEERLVEDIKRSVDDYLREHPDDR